ncbi:hypothetical protein Tco_1496641, partial [Tanacetum coccineum]
TGMIIFFWVDEFVVPADARFNWFSGSNIVKDRAPAPSEYNVEHINTLIAHASPFLRFQNNFFCWYGIIRMDLNAFIRTADPRKASVEREFAGDISVGDGGDQGFHSVAGQGNVKPSMPIIKPVEAEVPKPKRSKKKRVIYDSEGL